MFDGFNPASHMTVWRVFISVGGRALAALLILLWSHSTSLPAAAEWSPKEIPHDYRVNPLIQHLHNNRWLFTMLGKLQHCKPCSYQHVALNKYSVPVYLGEKSVHIIRCLCIFLLKGLQTASPTEYRFSNSFIPLCSFCPKYIMYLLKRNLTELMT